MRRVNLLHHDDVLNAYTKCTILIVTWLVGDNISRSKGDFGILFAGTYTDGALVNIQVGSYAVGGTVAIIKALILRLR
jgi:hypothetical protein